MLIESIFLAVFVCSLGGILFILARKTPVLTTLPKNGSAGFKKHHFVLEAENKIKDIFAYFEKQIYLHKLLSWVKVLTLKIETKVDHLLHKIRQKNKK